MAVLWGSHGGDLMVVSYRSGSIVTVLWLPSYGGGQMEALSVSRSPAPRNDQIKSILYNAMFTLHGLHCSPVYLLRLFIHFLSPSLFGTPVFRPVRPICRVV